MLSLGVAMDFGAHFYPLLDAVAARLTPNWVESIREYVKYGEINLAFETLCDAISECDVTIDYDLWARLRDMGKDMDVDASYWEMLNVAGRDSAPPN